MRWLRTLARLFFIVGVYVAAIAYVAWRIVKDREFWRTFIRGRT
jgi:hypothetical protein